MQGPIYRIEAADGSTRVIDVRRSAHSTPPAAPLAKALSLISDPALKIRDVLDFGAGMYKNEPLMLGLGMSVCAVEFAKERYAPLEAVNLMRSQTYKGFSRMTPREFVSSNRKFDIVTVVNSIPTMPIREERVEAVGKFARLLRKEGFLLWYAQKEDVHYRELRERGAHRILDGIYITDTFYKYHSFDMVDEAMRADGFALFKKLHLSTMNDAWLYQKAGN